MHNWMMASLVLRSNGTISSSKLCTCASSRFEIKMVADEPGQTRPVTSLMPTGSGWRQEVLACEPGPVWCRWASPGSRTTLPCPSYFFLRRATPSDQPEPPVTAITGSGGGDEEAICPVRFRDCR